ncbi:hypothetical protein ACFQ1L_26540 [Phytohabitans flavus]|nr:hypothetical protein [Phytohabitans flavus]
MDDENHTPAERAANPLPDLTWLPLQYVLGSDDSALTKSIQRLLDDMACPAERYAAHSSTL